MVTAVGNGKATITIKTLDGNKTATVTVTVKLTKGDQEEDHDKIKDESKLTGKELIARKYLPLLLVKGTGQTSSIKLTWLAEEETTKYEVYWSYCDGKQNYKKLTTSKLTATHKSLNKKKVYKYFVAAYKKIDGKKVYLFRSPEIHVAMKDTKYTNAKSIHINNTSVSVKQGETVTLKPTITLYDKKKKGLLHAAKLRYYSTDREIAYVSSKTGIVKGKKKGTCYIYILANNGVYKKVKVTVK